MDMLRYSRNENHSLRTGKLYRTSWVHRYVSETQMVTVSESLFINVKWQNVFLPINLIMTRAHTHCAVAQLEMTKHSHN